jgi:hypothetical protein
MHFLPRELRVSPWMSRCQDECNTRTCNEYALHDVLL